VLKRPADPVEYLANYLLENNPMKIDINNQQNEGDNED